MAILLQSKVCKCDEQFIVADLSSFVALFFSPLLFSNHSLHNWEAQVQTQNLKWTQEVENRQRRHKTNNKKHFCCCCFFLKEIWYSREVSSCFSYFISSTLYLKVSGKLVYLYDWCWITMIVVVMMMIQSNSVIEVPLTWDAIIHSSEVLKFSSYSIVFKKKSLFYFFKRAHELFPTMSICISSCLIFRWWAGGRDIIWLVWNQPHHP